MNDVMIGVAHDAPLEDDSPDFKNKYLESLTLIERLHRRLLDVIKDEFERRGDQDINAVQALLLFNMGGQELTAGELKSRGHYLGSNVSYNVKKMVENGYLIQERSPHDRRSFHVRASERGLEIYNAVSGLFDRHAEQLSSGDISEQALMESNQALRRLQQFWATPGSYISRMSAA